MNLVAEHIVTAPTCSVNKCTVPIFAVICYFTLIFAVFLFNVVCQEQPTLDIVKILKGNARFCGDPLAQNYAVTPTFIIWCDYMMGFGKFEVASLQCDFAMGLGKPKPYIKFKVASFSHCRNNNR